MRGNDSERLQAQFVRVRAIAARSCSQWQQWIARDAGHIGGLVE
jgi:hypothetical protein